MNAIELTRLTGIKVMVNVSCIASFSVASDERINKHPIAIDYVAQNGPFVYLLMAGGDEIFVRESYTDICRMLHIG